MRLDPRLRTRFLLCVLAGLAGWTAWSEAGRAGERLAALEEQAARAARAEAEQSQGALERARYERLAALVGERGAGPTSAAALRERLLRLAAAGGVDLSATHFQPLPRPPVGTRGAEARVTAEGPVPAVLGFAEAIESAGWPLQPVRVQLQIPVRPDDPDPPGALTFAFTVVWPDPDHPWPPPATVRLAADPRLEALENFFAELPASGAPSVPGPPDAAPVAATAPLAPSLPSPFPAPESREPGDPEALAAPELRGFVDLGGGSPVRAVLFHEGETILAEVGDRVGAWTLIEVSPSETVLLVHPERAPVRLTLR